MQHRVVITGLGAVSPYGLGWRTYWEGLRAGRSAIRKIESFDCEGLSSRVAGEVPRFDPVSIVGLKEARRLSRVLVMSIAAAREAAADAAWTFEREEEQEDCGVIVGCSSGGVDVAEKQYRLYHQGQLSKCSPFAITSTMVGAVSSEIAIDLKCRGMSNVVSTGCTSATDAIGLAYQNIRYGRIRRLITGGADAIVIPSIIESYAMMRCISTHFNDTPERASRPFNKDRDGFVLAEGAWLFTLERLEDALERGARIYGEIRGYGATCDAYHRVQISPDGRESARAMLLALADAGCCSTEVDYINLHGTSTQLNDKTETVAVKRAFSGRATSIKTSATKSCIGHPQGASGAAGLMATLCSVNEQFIHPTINYEYPDDDCDLDVTPNRGVKRKIDVALANCIAFGSKNAALVIGQDVSGKVER
jgi:3-oxoacyl-[acyl-carrier-protein] synthase II